MNGSGSYGCRDDRDRRGDDGGTARDGRRARQRRAAAGPRAGPVPPLRIDDDRRGLLVLPPPALPGARPDIADLGDPWRLRKDEPAQPPAPSQPHTGMPTRTTRRTGTATTAATARTTPTARSGKRRRRTAGTARTAGETPAKARRDTAGSDGDPGPVKQVVPRTGSRRSPRRHRDGSSNVTSAPTASRWAGRTTRSCRPAAAEVALGGLAAVWNPWIGGVLAAVGASRVGTRVVAGRRRRRSTAPPAALFLDPRITKLELTETFERHGRAPGRTLRDLGHRRLRHRHDGGGLVASAHRRDRGPPAQARAACVGRGRVLGRLADRQRPGAAGAARTARSPSRRNDHSHAAGAALTRFGPRGSGTRGRPRRPAVDPHHRLHRGRSEAGRTGSGLGDRRPRAGLGRPRPGARRAVVLHRSPGRCGEPGGCPQAERIEELRLSVPGAWGEVENVGGAEHHTTTGGRGRAGARSPGSGRRSSRRATAAGATSRSRSSDGSSRRSTTCHRSSAARSR